MPETLTWFTVRRADGRSDASSNNVWIISKRTPATLGQTRPPGWWAGDFTTREEAVDHGRAQGWTLVENWAQAEALYEPARRQAQEEHRYAAERRRDLIEIRIGSQLRYVPREMADTLTQLMRDHDEMGVCTAFSGGVVLR